MRGFRVLLLVAAAGCAARPGAPRPSVPGTGAPPATAQPATPGVVVSPCHNAQYRFECVVPEGYILTQERRGPGTIMAFSKQARGSEEEGNLAVRVTPLGPKRTLESFVDRRVARDLKKAQGVASVQKEATLIGGRPGVELIVDREYASGSYRSRIFCFQEGANVFIVDHTVPAARFDREKVVLDSLVESLLFSN